MSNSNDVNAVWLDRETVDLSDEAFSAAVAGVVRIRRARNEGTAEARQMAIATQGVSLSPAYGSKTPAQLSADRKQDIYNSYVRSGLTHAEAARRIRELE